MPFPAWYRVMIEVRPRTSVRARIALVYSNALPIISDETFPPFHGNLRAGIETAGRIVPAENRGAGGQGLNNRNSLSLTTRNTTHKSVTDFGIVGMLDAHGLEQELSRLLSQLFA